MEQKVIVEFSEGEISALMQLLDAAVRQVGLQGAEAAVIIAKKLEQSVKIAPTGEG
jgi:hypothetical protein